MATVGALAVTMMDYRKRLDPDGSLAFIMENCAQQNEIMKRIKWMEGNLPTGIQTTMRTSLPTPSIRVINRGVDASKSTTEQIVDTCMMYESRSCVDIELLALQTNKEAFRRSEDAAHIEGYAQEIANTLIYGDIKENPDKFNGIAVRYNTFTGDKGTAGYQVIDAGMGSSSATNGSAYLIGFGEHATAGIYPKGTQCGMQMRDLGEGDVFDPNGKPYRALQTLFKYNAGLTVRDIRQNAAVRNIDCSALTGITDANAKALVNKFIYAKNRIRNLSQPGTDFAWYVPDAIYDFLEVFLLNKNNVHVTRADFEGGVTGIRLSGIPVFKMDCMKTTEAKI